MPDATPVVPPTDPAAGQTAPTQQDEVTDVAVIHLADSNGNALNVAMILEKAGAQYVVTFYDATSNQFLTGSDDAGLALYAPATPKLNNSMTQFGVPGNLLTIQQQMAVASVENMADPQPPIHAQDRYDPTIKIMTSPTTGKTSISGFFPVIDTQIPPPAGTGGIFGPIRLQGGVNVQVPILPTPGMPNPSLGIRIELPFGRLPKRPRPQPAPATQPPAPPPAAPTPPPPDGSSAPPNG